MFQQSCDSEPMKKTLVQICINNFEILEVYLNLQFGMSLLFYTDLDVSSHGNEACVEFRIKVCVRKNTAGSLASLIKTITLLLQTDTRLRKFKLNLSSISSSSLFT